MNVIAERIRKTISELRDIKIQILELQKQEQQLYNTLLSDMESQFAADITETMITRAQQ